MHHISMPDIGNRTINRHDRVCAKMSKIRHWPLVWACTKISLNLSWT